MSLLAARGSCLGGCAGWGTEGKGPRSPRTIPYCFSLLTLSFPEDPRPEPQTLSISQASLHHRPGTRIFYCNPQCMVCFPTGGFLSLKAPSIHWAPGKMAAVISPTFHGIGCIFFWYRPMGSGMSKLQPQVDPAIFFLFCFESLGGQGVQHGYEAHVPLLPWRGACTGQGYSCQGSNDQGASHPRPCHQTRPLPRPRVWAKEHRAPGCS